MKKSKSEKFIDSVSAAVNLITKAQSKADTNYLFTDEILTDVESGEEVTMEEIFAESNDNRKMIDAWVEKQLLGNPEIKPYNKRPYPYRKYCMIEELLHKYGSDFLNKMGSLLPSKLKRNSDQAIFVDSIAWVIWDKKLDPHSIMPDMPEFGSFWDKISEDGYAE